MYESCEAQTRFYSRNFGDSEVKRLAERNLTRHMVRDSLRLAKVLHPTAGPPQPRRHQRLCERHQRL